MPNTLCARFSFPNHKLTSSIWRHNMIMREAHFICCAHCHVDTQEKHLNTDHPVTSLLRHTDLGGIMFIWQVHTFQEASLAPSRRWWMDVHGGAAVYNSLVNKWWPSSPLGLLKQGSKIKYWLYYSFGPSVGPCEASSSGDGFDVTGTYTMLHMFIMEIIFSFSPFKSCESTSLFN